MDMTNDWNIALIFFFYGLAFFSMGLAIMLEIGRCSDARLRKALRPLAVFGFLHGAHEWLEMFEILEILPGWFFASTAWSALRLMFLAWSFLSLAAFGGYLLAGSEQTWRLSFLVPLGLASIWGFGLFYIQGQFSYVELPDVADVWTRYTLAIPSALTASVGLVVQQREFRKAGLAQFGRDSLWAAVAFIWYGLIGQLFTRASALPPSNVINGALFLQLFGFPVQLLRATAAVAVSVFVIRFMRSFEVEIQRQLTDLQAAQLEDAQRRDIERGEILRKIVQAQEAERQRVARELHDETGQSLTAIGLGLRSITTLLGQDTEKASRNLRQLEGLVEHSLNELQRLIADLRPSHLDDLGLAAALRWYAAEVQNRTQLEIVVEIYGDKRSLSTEMNMALFRIVQEALTNVFKHADAKRVMVTLSFEDESVVARVMDDGRGFDMRRLEKADRSPLGLVGMRERASLLGGHLEITSQPGRGATVEAVIPYDGVLRSDQK